MKRGFDGQGTVYLNMVGYKDCEVNEMGLVMPEKSFWGDLLRKTQNYQIYQRRLTPEERRRHWGKRK